MRWLLISAIAACGGAAPTPQPPAAQPAAPDDLVDVIALGAPTRQLVRYQFKVGQTEDVDFDMQMTQTMSFDDTALGARQQRNEVPTVRTRIRMTVNSIDADGAAKVTWAYTASGVAPEARVEPQMRQVLDEAMGKFVGTRGSMTVSVRGASTDVKVDIPAGVDQQMRDGILQTLESLKRMYIAFPRDPVGIGAQWDIKARLPMMGASVDTTYRYKLVEATGRWIKLSVDMVQQAGPQPIEQGALRGKLISLSTKGRGTSSLPLDRLVPDAKVDAKTEFSFTIGDHDEMKVAAVMEVAMTMKPVK